MPRLCRRLLPALALLALAPGMRGDNSPSPPRKPNIIFILCDDLGINDVGCYTYPSFANPGPPPPTVSTGTLIPPPNPARHPVSGATLTPRLDTMAAQGTRFTSFYSTSSVCSPTRAAFLTGSYPQRIGVNAVFRPESTTGLNTREVTIAEILKTRGYATGAVGKWHLGFQPQFLPTRQGFDSFYGLPYSNDMVALGPLPLLENETVIDSDVTDAEQALLTQNYTARALGFIEANQSRPFFLYLAHTMPHVPVFASPAFVGRSGRGDFYDVVMELDWSTGQILDKLAELGLEEHTLVVFSSDNGPWHVRSSPNSTTRSVGSAYPYRDSKISTYEGGHRVPFIARWPGRIPAGGATEAMASTFDLFTTFARLAGGEIPTDRVIDGRDIWLLLAAEPGAATPHDAFFFIRVTANAVEGVRKGSWKRRINSLFDLSSDLQERTDVDGANASLVTELDARLEAFRADLVANARPVGQLSSQEIVVDTTDITVSEGGTATFGVRLATDPGTSTITVDATRLIGDADISVQAGATLAFRTGNWNVFQNVTVAAAPDADTLNGTASIRLSSPNFQPVREVYVTEQDTDPLPGPAVNFISPLAEVVDVADHSVGLVAEAAAALNGVPVADGVTFSWSQSSGPMSAIFGSPTAKATALTLPAVGLYVIRATAEANGRLGYAEFSIRAGVREYAPPERDLVLRLKLDESAGNTAANSAALPLVGTLSGGPIWQPADGRVAGALGFAADAQLVKLPHSPAINSAPQARRTVALWFKVTDKSITSRKQVLFEEGGTAKGLNLYVHGGSLYFGGYNAGVHGWNSTFLSTDAFASGQWHHAAAVLEGTTTTAPGAFRAYLDGMPIGSGPGAILDTHIDPTGIGNVSGNSSFHDATLGVGASHGLAGALDELLIYNRSLSPDEIATLAGLGFGLNRPPRVSAGPDRQSTFPEPVVVSGTVQDDAEPFGVSLAQAWIQASGGSPIIFANPLDPISAVSWTRPGDYRLRLTADDGQFRSFDEMMLSVLPLSYAEWSSGFELPAHLSGFTDDADGDGLANGLEFGLGLPPDRVGTSGEVMEFSRSEDFVQLTFVRPVAAGLSYIVLGSADLHNWAPVGGPPLVEPLSDEREKITVTVPVPVLGQRYFLRLRVRE